MNWLETPSGVMALMAVCLLVFALLSWAACVALPANQALIQLFSNLTTGFGAALLTAAQLNRKDPRP